MPEFLTFAVMVIVSPTVGVGLEKVISEDVIDRFGFTFANALSAKAVEYGSSSREPLGSCGRIVLM